MNNTTRNWKTSLAGALVLAMTGWNVYANPKLAESPEGQAAILAGVSAGVGLIGAKDGDKSGTIPKRRR